MILSPALLGQDIASGQSFRLSPIDVKINGTIESVLGQTTNVDIVVAAYVFNRTTNPVDIDSSNNIIFHSILWEKQYGASIASNKLNTNVKVYPNPANEELKVELGASAAQNTTVELVDLKGKVIFKEEVPSLLENGILTLNVSSLQNGLYVVRTISGDDIKTTKVNIAH